MNRSVANITRADALNSLDKIAQTGATAMAGRVMACAPELPTGGLSGAGRCQQTHSKTCLCAGITQCDRVLSDDEMRCVWSAMGAMGYPFGPFDPKPSIQPVPSQFADGGTWRTPASLSLFRRCLAISHIRQADQVRTKVMFRTAKTRRQDIQYMRTTRSLAPLHSQPCCRAFGP